ncbi:response regulator [Armatimonas rosea]|uniref:DNA-binding response OmpR family regulator n=1 Tax=Armatimonas rosea TaxID=685828 RepID=A0A7W9SQV7_ARMRO|nr:response regulator [Armatimonas rosea]MBB6050324.1 DNA-binding response OmpR family regulator [Armatimonas rosea]
MNPVVLFFLGMLVGIVALLVLLWFVPSSESSKPDPRPTLPPFPPNPVPQGEHILVVDDNPQLADQVAACLREAGYAVEIVHSAEEAWVSLRLKLPVLVITDDILPGADGWELLRCTRRSELMDIIPVVRLGEKEHERFMFGYPGFMFDMELVKPFDCEELVSFVRRILQPASVEGERYRI